MLTWHQLTEEVSGSATISPETFRKQIQALSDAGCNTISLEQLRDYVYNGTPLPEKPIVLTFDDGYLSNYEDAFPVDVYKRQDCTSTRQTAHCCCSANAATTL